MEKLADRIVLVTGATGTVGSAVARALTAEGARVRALCRGNAAADGAAETVHGDLEDLASLRAAVRGCALVVHCAAEVSDDRARCQAANVDGTRRLIEAMLAEGHPRLVHISTASVYDFRKRLDFDEDAATWTEPLDAYGYTKAEAERIVRESGLPATILRPVQVMSMHPRSFWGPKVLERARTGQGPVAPLATVPFVHVDNLAQAVVLAATRDAAVGRTYDVIDGEGDRREYADAVYAAIGRPTPPLSEGAPHVRFRGERIRSELGYAPADRWRTFLDELRRYRG